MNRNINHILVPTDFSGYSKKSFTYALLIAGKMGASVSLMHCIEPPYDFASTVESTLEQLKRGAKRKLDEMFKEAMKDERFKDVHVDTALVTGMTKASIIEFVDLHDIDFIVMGSMGVSALRKRLFGSNSIDIALRASVPVLVVPESITDTEFENILYATDYRENDLESIRYLGKMAELFNASVHVVHIEEDDNLESDIRFRGFRELVREEGVYDKLTFDHYFDSKPFVGLSRYMEDKNIDILSMTRYRKSLIKSLFDKNHTKEMSYYSEIPILVIPGDG